MVGETRKFLLTAVVLIAVLASVGSNHEEAEKTGEADNPSGTAAPSAAPEVFKVGDIVKLGDLEVVVRALRNPLPSQNQFIKPKPGNRFVGVDMEVKNPGATEETFSIIAGAEVQDAQNQTFSPAFTDHEPKAPDGAIPPGSSRRGLLVVEMPNASAGPGMKLLFKSSFFGKTAVINLT